jgi:hypothetical protein
MFNNHDSDQFTLSLELLRLMQWLVKNDPEGLKRLISKAMNQGLNKQVSKALETDDIQETSTQIQHGIIDFFILMEALLSETMYEHSMKKGLQKNLIPAMQRIDTTDCDASIVLTSLEQATSQLQSQPNANPRDLLLNELIKRWKPNKKKVH